MPVVLCCSLSPSLALSLSLFLSLARSPAPSFFLRSGSFAFLRMLWLILAPTCSLKHVSGSMKTGRGRLGSGSRGIFRPKIQQMNLRCFEVSGGHWWELRPDVILGSRMVAPPRVRRRTKSRYADCSRFVPVGQKSQMSGNHQHTLGCYP